MSTESKSNSTSAKPNSEEIAELRELIAKRIRAIPRTDFNEANMKEIMERHVRSMIRPPASAQLADIEIDINKETGEVHVAVTLDQGFFKQTH